MPDAQQPRPELHPAHGTRLDRAVSKLGAASRAHAATLIRAGRVTVDGRRVRDPGAAVRMDRQTLALDGSPILRRAWRTVLLHKPRGVVTTRRDPQRRPTVFDLLGDAAGGLVAVGRLDLASTGLLLLTTDTRLANWLTDPSSGILRRYLVTARGRVDDDDVARMCAGIAGLKADGMVVRKRSSRESHLVVDLREGKNREIRRLLDATGHEVTRLKRVSYGGLELGTLPSGGWREVPLSEIRQTFPAAPTSTSLSE